MAANTMMVFVTPECVITMPASAHAPERDGL
jgi:hypothetical protein